MNTAPPIAPLIHDETGYFNALEETIEVVHPSKNYTMAFLDACMESPARDSYVLKPNRVMAKKIRDPEKLK